MRHFVVPLQHLVELEQLELPILHNGLASKDRVARADGTTVSLTSDFSANSAGASIKPGVATALPEGPQAMRTIADLRGITIADWRGIMVQAGDSMGLE
jgi:hypothetical protein